MSLNNCKECGKQVRLRGVKVRNGVRNGIAHYIEHADGSAMHSNDWLTVMLKPYPKINAPYDLMIDKWNKENYDH